MLFRSRGGKHLFSSSDEDSGDNDDDEPPREKQSVDVWLPPAPPNFHDHKHAKSLTSHLSNYRIASGSLCPINQIVYLPPDAFILSKWNSLTCFSMAAFASAGNAAPCICSSKCPPPTRGHENWGALEATKRPPIPSPLEAIFAVVSTIFIAAREQMLPSPPRPHCYTSGDAGFITVVASIGPPRSLAHVFSSFYGEVA